MADSAKEKALIIAEIQKRIAHLVSTDQISDEAKIIIARNVLNLIENGEKQIDFFGSQLYER